MLSLPILASILFLFLFITLSSSFLPPPLLRLQTSLNLNLLIHPHSTPFNSTHSFTSYPPTHNYIKHCKTILKKEKNIKQSLLGFYTVNGDLVDDTFIYPTPLNKFTYSSSPLSLILSVPRPPILKFLIKTLSTLGISEIVLCRSDKSQRDYYGSHLLKNFTSTDSKGYDYTDNIGEQIIEGLVQSGLPYPPKIKLLGVNELNRYIKGHSQIPEYGLEYDFKGFKKIIPHLTETNNTISKVLSTSSNAKTVFAIGPEGGWTDEEVDLFEDKGFKVISLGESILKVEQAAVVCCGVGIDYYNSREE
ncbi:hypothetical protein TL16_g03442 [Triparma laevis f. inornata]|uniref:16S rRNA (uracil(1498)-N(3))-methyltransferase n=2 Tax=Triparma laevis TaxID=1534972 RepID=A0A9W7DQU2_9STRA|nr:hypothetical protein TrLO_g8707 [Triparma laevis f. longispina]GMH62276.1 hypothetical protein TL16_g03442 [Triparma laevis f. inornata]